MIFIRIPSLLCACLFATTVWAQSPGPLRLHRGDLDTRAFAQPRPGATGNRSFEGSTHCILQFTQVPTASQREALAAHGITLLDYLPQLCWIASVRGADPFSLPAQIRPWAVIPITADLIISQKLRELPLPAWALRPGGYIDLTVTCFNDIAPARALAALQAGGYSVIESFEYGQYFTVRVLPAQVEALAALPFVSFVEPVSPEAQPENYSGHSLHRGNVIASEFVTGRHYDGSGVVVAMGDDGTIGPHIDYQGRVDNNRVAAINNGNHGDHVAGTIMGAGNLNPKHRGMARGSTLEVYSVWDAVNESPTDHYADSVIITSTSYSDGCNVGYTSFARSADRMMRQHPKLLHVFSAGNQGADDCGYGAGATWGNVTGGVKIGKNVLTVGNLGEFDGLDGSSSRGPAHDGRIKPEVCAKGTNVTSTIDDNTYASFSGTSMACPGTSGTLAQLNQAYRELNGGDWAPSALIKAVVMNTCEDIGNAGPDFKHGFGRLNARMAAECLEAQRYWGDSIAQGENDTFTINVPPGTAQLRVMLYWHDYEAANMASVALVNNLNMEITDPANNVWLPWVLDHSPTAAALNSPATRGTDNLNNVEQITLDNPTAGSYQVRINSVLIPQGPQPYFVTYEIIDSSITVTWPFGGESMVPGETEVLRWDAAGDAGTFQVEFSADNGGSWTTINAAVPGAQRHLSWSVPLNLTPSALVRVSRGMMSDVSDTTFNIMSVPGNLQVLRACTGSVTLKWNALASTASYDVYQLGSRYMDHVGNTTADTFVVTGLNQFDEYWFAVRAVGTSGAKGRRCVAVRKTPGVWNCLDPDDVAVESVSAPPPGSVQSCIFSGSQPVTVTLRNHSPNTGTGFPVSYRINSGTVVTETFTGSLPGYGTAIHTFTPIETFTSGNTYTLQAWTGSPADANSLNDSITSVSTIVSSSAFPLPYAQDFENFALCGSGSNCEAGTCTLAEGWLNAESLAEDDIDWRTFAGATPTSLTGPDLDHNPGTAAGRYLYLEASSCFGKTAYVLTPCIDLGSATSPQLSFWIHLYGAEMGTLHLDLFDGTQWTLDILAPMLSNWGNVWWERNVSLGAWAGQTVVLRWRGETGTASTSDMAIDDIQISDLTSSPNALVNGGFRVFPVPGDGHFTLQNGGDDHQSMALRVTDAQGRLCFEESGHAFPAGHSQALSLSHLPAGMYLLTVITEQGQWQQRLLIQ